MNVWQLFGRATRSCMVRYPRWVDRRSFDHGATYSFHHPDASRVAASCW